MRVILVTMISLLALFGLYARAEVSVDDLLLDILKGRGSYEAAKQNLKEANKRGMCPEDEDLLNLYRIIINGCALRDDDEEKYNAIAGKINGRDVVVFVYDEGKDVGKIASAFEPNPSQRLRWGIPVKGD